MRSRLVEFALAGLFLLVFAGYSPVVLSQADESSIPHIFVARADGTEAFPITTGLRPAWSPDGTRIAFYRPGSDSRRGDMFLIDADGSNAYWLGPGIEPAWSPDGQQIVFTSEWGLEVQEVCCAGNRRQLIHHNFPVGLPYFEGGTDAESDQGVGKADWSPDGEQIVFEHFGDGEWGTALVWIMNADGTGLRRLEPKSDFRTAESDAAWSPDGSKIALWSFDQGLHTVDPVSGSVRQVYYDSNQAVVYGAKPTWSSNGDYIAFRGAFAVSEGFEIWLVSSQGGPATVLVPQAYDPDWSPGRTSIAFVRNMQKKPPAGEFPVATGAVSIFERESPHLFPLDARSRFLFWDDGTFELQYVLVGGQNLSYRGSYIDNKSYLELFFLDDGRWQAEAVFSPELNGFEVRYNTTMALSDFEDGIYLHAREEPEGPVKDPDEPKLPPPGELPTCRSKCDTKAKLAKTGISDPN